MSIRAFASAEVSAIGTQLKQEYGKDMDAVRFTVVPQQEYMVGNVRGALVMIFVAVGFLLAVACMTVSCARTGIGASKVPVDRTVLPIAESSNPSITELNVSKATLNGGSRRETVSSTEFRW